MLDMTAELLEMKNVRTPEELASASKTGISSEK